MVQQLIMRNTLLRLWIFGYFECCFVFESSHFPAIQRNFPGIEYSVMGIDGYR